MQFDESKHPRDDEGKFTTKEFRQNTSYEDILKNDYNDLSVEELKERQTIDLSKKKLSLTKSEWARFYKRLGEIQSGGHVDKRKNGDKLIILHKMSNNAPKVVVTAGTYEKPKIRMIIEFETEEDMFDVLERMKWQ